MTAVLAIAGDVVREAARRRWFVGLAAGITLLLGALAFGLRMDVIDGALAATRLFGELVSNDVRSADVALRPVFEAAAGLIFYGGLVFGLQSCADFAPGLLAPGRIEHLLALPVKRWELVVGTFLGVLFLGFVGSLYGAGGLSLILGWKTGIWSPRLVLAAALACGGFAAVYAAMLGAALVVRSAAFSTATGALVLGLGILASFRNELLKLFQPGLGRVGFDLLTAPFPRFALLGKAAISVAGSAPLDLLALARVLGGVGLFTAALLALGIFRLEQKDF